MPAWPRSLQGRLVALVLGVVVAVGVAAVWLSWRDMRHELDELLDAHLAQAASLLVVQNAGDIGGDVERTFDAPSLHKYAPRAMFQVFHEGQLVVRSADAPPTPLLGLAAQQSVIGAGASAGGARPSDDGRNDDRDDEAGARHGRGRERAGDGGFADVQLDGVTWRVFATYGAESDIRVYVAERYDARSGIMRAALRGTLLPLALALPLLGLLVWAAVFRALAPLRALRRQLAARAPDSLQALQLAAAPAEVTPVVDALNALFGRIAELLDSERRFTADAAHELRTPIAAVRAQVQVALGATDAGERRRALEATLAGCDRAARLVNQLLTLARVEAGADVPRGPVDMAALARRVAAELAPQAIARGQELGLDVTAGAPCVIAGDATLLAALLRNLVDNALRYSPQGARIALRVRAEDGRVALDVEDGGPGLSEDERAQLGQRFHRGAGHSASGSGLGWSIVRRIAAALGLTVTVERSTSLGGLAVHVSGPAL